MMKKTLFIFLLLLISDCCPITQAQLEPLLKKLHPFAYPLDLVLIPSKQSNANITICCHGYGHCNKVAQVVHSFNVIPDHLIGFNFPDYGITPNHDHHKTSFGSIEEILPLLYVIKIAVIDGGVDAINLYGFSAGGGTIINLLAILNKSGYKEEFKKIGVSATERKKIIAALEKGFIILDCPLKSIEEIMDIRGKEEMLMIMGDRYKKNNMRPIDTLEALDGLKLNILLHFQNPDEILSNRDDTLFADKLIKANAGKTHVLIGKEGGHNSYHSSLWKEYSKIKK